MLKDGEEKARLIRDYVVREDGFRYRVFIETGTSHAETLRCVAGEPVLAIYRCYSFDNDYEKYLNATYLTNPYDNIRLVYGDSAQHLPRLLDELGGPALVFLDAHPEDNRQTPLLAELGHLFYRVDRSGWLYTILIDDARCFDEFDQWPSIEEIRREADRVGYLFEVKDDIIRLTPPEN